MSIQAFAVCECGDDRTKLLQPIRSDLLRRDVLLERERVDAAELASVAVRRQRVVRAGCVVTAAAFAEKVRLDSAAHPRQHTQ